MGKSSKAVPHSDTEPDKPAGRKTASAALKWVGGATAVLSLVFGVQQLIDVVSAHLQRSRQVKELLATSAMQEQARDYAAAWSSLEQASRLSDGGSKTRTVEESLAMDWLENASAPDQQKFSDITEKVTPVLDQAASSAQGQRKADVLAHLGWAAFLQSRDGAPGTSPDSYYRQALAVDPQNVFAHAMLGHWILWNDGPVSEAAAEFNQALAGGRHHDFVRELQLAALEDANNNEGNLELLRVLNAMRKNGEAADTTTRGAAWFIYSHHLEPVSMPLSARPAAQGERPPLLAALAPQEQLATFTWLFDGPNFNQSPVWQRDFYRGILEGEAGRHTEALQSLRSALSELSQADPDAASNEAGTRQAIQSEIAVQTASLAKP